MEDLQYNDKLLCKGKLKAKGPLLENVGRGNGRKRHPFPNCKTMLFFNRMSSYAKLRLCSTHLIPEVPVNVVMANLMSPGIVVDPNNDCKD